MTTNLSNENPVACELTDAALTSRLDELRTAFLPHVKEVRELADGYRLRFAWDVDRIREIGGFIAFESNCCRFAMFRLDVEASKQQLQLQITGPRGTKEFLQGAMLGCVRGAEGEEPADEAAAAPGRALTRTGIATLGGAAVAVLCCVVPVLGIVGLGAGTAAYAGYLDAGAAVGLVVGASLVALGRFARRRYAEKRCACDR